jgi:hypothetical protein
MRIRRIAIYPIKSLDGLFVEEACVTAGGILAHDRVYALMDAEGKVVNGKRTPRVHQLRCAFDAAISEVRLWHADVSSPAQFSLAEPAKMNAWLGEFFGFPIFVRHEPDKGFPDDREAFGPTIVSEASLRAIRDWYPGLTVESLRRRFRANLELEDGPPFCEDGLFGAPDERKPFQIGDVQFLGHNPCQRCVVPTRDPDSGEARHDFQKQFAQFRQQHLPAWSDPRRFNHYYRFAINTSIPPTEAGKVLRGWDPVKVPA